MPASRRQIKVGVLTLLTRVLLVVRDSTRPAGKFFFLKGDRNETILEGLHSLGVTPTARVRNTTANSKCRCAQIAGNVVNEETDNG